MNQNVITDTASNDSSGIDAIFKRFDQLLSQHTTAIVQTLNQLALNNSSANDSSAANQVSELLSASASNTPFSGSNGNQNGHAKNDLPDPVNSAVGFNSHPFRLSQGQMWTQVASAINKAMTRNV